MQTTTRYKEGVAILEPTGRIIGPAIPKLRKKVIAQVDTTYTPRVLIDFANVHRMDSAGLGVFLNAYKIAHAREGRIAIINVGRHIRNLIVQARLINLFEHYENEEEAVAALSECA